MEIRINENDFIMAYSNNKMVALIKIFEGIPDYIRNKGYEKEYEKSCVIVTYPLLGKISLISRDKGYRKLLDFALNVCKKKRKYISISEYADDTIALGVIMSKGFKLIGEHTENNGRVVKDFIKKI